MCADACCRKPKYDLDTMEGAWKRATPLLGNVLELLTPNFHRKVRQQRAAITPGTSSSRSSSRARACAQAHRDMHQRFAAHFVFSKNKLSPGSSRRAVLCAQFLQWSDVHGGINRWAAQHGLALSPWSVCVNPATCGKGVSQAQSLCVAWCQAGTASTVCAEEADTAVVSGSPCRCLCRFKFLWHDVVLVTDPAALATIMGRGEHAVDKAFETYAPINKMCDPHGQVGRQGQQHTSTVAQLQSQKQWHGRTCFLLAATVASTGSGQGVIAWVHADTLLCCCCGCACGV